MATPELDPRAAPAREPHAADKPVIIGIYGIPGSGKTFLLNHLRKEMQQNGTDHFDLYDGSDVISSLVPGGIGAFPQLSEEDKGRYRCRAIQSIAERSAASGRAAIVAGHVMFWAEGEAAGQYVYTQADLATYSHILYLDVPAEIIAQRWLEGGGKKRGAASAEHLRRWQQEEKTGLRRLCMDRRILYSALDSSRIPDLAAEVSKLVDRFRLHTEEHNLRCAKDRLERLLDCSAKEPSSFLVLDADKTLAAEDTGTLLWEMISLARGSSEADALRKIFSSPLGYTHGAFVQASLLYEEVGRELDFGRLCEAAAGEVALRDEFLDLLKQARSSAHVHAVVVTCGVAAVWEKILQEAGLEGVPVMGYSPVGDDNLIVTPRLKAAVVTHLREVHRCPVFAFGDSPLDLPMLLSADEAIVVVGEEGGRSRSMELELEDAISKGLRARQVLLPSTVTPRLDATRLPVTTLGGPELMAAMFRQQTQPACPVLHATNKGAAKLLMTSMRDASVSGPALREAHRRVGWYLAVEFLADLLGLERYAIPHVQGHQTEGHRLAHEREVLVVALMRGGEAIAFGVNDAFPLAMFLHAKQPQDIQERHVEDRRVVLLVDSVVNNGKTAADFAHRVRELQPNVRIVVVAGVVQSDSITGEGMLARTLARDDKLGVVALRLSENRFTGRGTTDTGNRLFNSTHLP